MPSSGNLLVRSCIGLLWLAFLSGPQDVDADDFEFFETRIRPVLVEHCYECHSQEADQTGQQQAGLFLDSALGIRQGGDSGPAIDDTHSRNSLLLTAMRYESLEMPPEGRLSDQVIADFEYWLDQGAPDPRTAHHERPSNAMDFDQARSHWAYQPVAFPTVRAKQENRDSSALLHGQLRGAASAIDQMLLNSWETTGVVPQPVASRDELIRRVTLDLTGLPPTEEEIYDFAHDRSPLAWERVVDRLLANPAFGERFGRHWLDLSRFAESVTLRGLVQHQAWRYRDYVIQSLNGDKPYDQFVREQIAGDLMPSNSLEQAWEQCIATTFLALGNTNLEEQDKEQLRMDVVDEQLSVIGSALLGQTLGCARCHDHKFDPIPTRDYYAIASILRNVQALEDDNVSRWIERPLPLNDVEEAKFRALEERLKELKSLVQTAEKNKEGDAKELVKSLKSEIQSLQKQLATRPKFMSVRERTTIEEGHVLIRGNVHNQGKVTPRGFLSVLPHVHASAAMPNHQSGRMELADWVSSANNPLVARVMVNRLWSWLLGAGIVRTPDNFGTTGQSPTHPELLDYLSGRMIETGWSIKALIREIVLSDAYQRSSLRRSDLDQLDPENLLWARAFSKPLTAESMLDSILVVSQDIDFSMGGKLFPDSLEADYGYQNPTTRRAIYWPLLRNQIPELLQVFDGANPSMVTGQRSHSIVAPQASFMMNHPWLVERCDQAAKAFLAESIARPSMGSDRAKIQTLYRRLLTRLPSAAEEDLIMDFLYQERVNHEQACDARLSPPDKERQCWRRIIQSLVSSIDFRYCP